MKNMKIIFPHIPKCAGSSIKEQLDAHEDIYFDYFNHPTWMSESDKSIGRIQQADLKSRLATLNNWTIFGHFDAGAYDDLEYDFKVLLLRDPLERAISQFHYIRQSLPDNEVTRRRHKEVGPIKDGHFELNEFASLDHVRFFYGKYYLRELKPDSRLIVLTVENIKSSFETLAQSTGLRLNSSIHVNKSVHAENFEYLRPRFVEDTDLYTRLTEKMQG